MEIGDKVVIEKKCGNVYCTWVESMTPNIGKELTISDIREGGNVLLFEEGCGFLYPIECIKVIDNYEIY